MRLQYKEMKFETNGNPDNPVVKVFQNSCFLRPVFVTTSLDLAMRWVDGQIDCNHTWGGTAADGTAICIKCAAPRPPQ